MKNRNGILNNDTWTCPLCQAEQSIFTRVCGCHNSIPRTTHKKLTREQIKELMKLGEAAHDSDSGAT